MYGHSIIPWIQSYTSVTNHNLLGRHLESCLGRRDWVWWSWVDQLDLQGAERLSSHRYYPSWDLARMSAQCAPGTCTHSLLSTTWRNYNIMHIILCNVYTWTESDWWQVNSIALLPLIIIILAQKFTQLYPLSSQLLLAAEWPSHLVLLPYVYRLVVVVASHVLPTVWGKVYTLSLGLICYNPDVK